MFQNGMGCKSSKVTQPLDILKSSKLELRECFYESNRYIAVIVIGKFHVNNQVLQALTNMRGLTRMPIKGSGHMCDMDYISTWKWCPAQPASKDDLARSLNLRKTIFLI